MFPNGMNNQPWQQPLTSMGPRPNVPGSPPYQFGGPMAGPAGPYGGAGGNFDINALVNSPQGQQFLGNHPQLQQMWNNYQQGNLPGGQNLQSLLANRTPAGMAQTLQGLPRMGGGGFRGF